jgi:cytochrome P450
MFNPLDPDHYHRPYVRLAELRRTCPVSRPLPGFVFVSRYDDVREQLRDHEHLSNAGNFRLDQDPSSITAVVHMDPPRHTLLRKLIVRAFSPGVVAAAEPRIRAHAERLIGAFADRGTAELIDALARPLPAVVLAEMVGVPTADVPTFVGWTNEVVAVIPAVGDQPALRSLSGYCARLVDDRRGAAVRPDDLITRLIEAEVDGDRLSDAEVVGTIVQLILAGQDTVTRLIGNCAYELLREPDRWRRIQADRSLVPVAIEESLRHDSPLQWAMRTCVKPTEVGAVGVAPGERVLLGIGSANRDERLWEDAERFSLDRPTGGNHLAFGHGIHLCLGAALGRSEGRIAVETLLDLLPGLRLADGYEYRMTDTAMARGPARLDVVWPVPAGVSGDRATGTPGAARRDSPL